MIFSNWGVIPFVLAVSTSLAGSQPMTPRAATDTAAPRALTASIATEATSVMRWYRQTVYDRMDRRVGEIDDLLVDRTGKVVALIIGIGPQGMSTKHVALNFSDVRASMDGNGDVRLTIATSAEGLADAPGYEYDHTFMTWSSASPSPTTGGPLRR